MLNRKKIKNLRQKPNFNIIFPIIILMLSLSIRLWNLNLIPASISHVELDYVINAKSVWLTGKDLSQKWSAMSFQALNSRETLAELPQVILAPFIGPNPFSLFNARWPLAIIYGLIPVLLYFISHLFFNRKTAFITGILFCLNPWSIHFSRTAYETSLATVLYLAGIYFLFRKSDKNMLFSVIFFFLGFFCYHGAKAMLIPLVIVLCFFHYLINKNRQLIKYYAIITGISLILMLGFIISLSHQPAGSRSKQIIFFNQEYLASQVNQERLFTIPNPLVNLYTNKFTIMMKEMLNTYLNAYSPLTLFGQGEQAVGGLTLGKHGYFYYFDIILLFLGLISAYCLNRQSFYFLVSLLIIAPINSIISIEGQSYVNRAALLFPITGIFIGLGFTYLLTSFRHWILPKILIVTIYLLLLGNFLYLYYYQNPIYNSEGFFFSKRILAEYLKRAVIMNKLVYVYADEHMAAYEQYLFYGNKINKLNIQPIAYAMSNKVFNIDQISFESGCPSMEVLNNPNAILIVESLKSCQDLNDSKDKASTAKIVNLADNGAIFNIYNDSICQSYNLHNYVRVLNLETFKLDQQNDALFCSQWIVR